MVLPFPASLHPASRRLRHIRLDSRSSDCRLERDAFSIRPPCDHDPEFEYDILPLEVDFMEMEADKTNEAFAPKLIDYLIFKL